MQKKSTTFEIQRTAIVSHTKSLVLLCFVSLVGIFALTRPVKASAETAGDQSFVCDQVARLASAQSGVPVSVLKAISLTETGRNHGGQMRPWPWTVNMEGTGVWFDGEEEALAYVLEHFEKGARSFDVGCFQINYKWHHQNFSSIEEMFDPVANGLYAAKFLSDLFHEKGNWADAAGAYHSRTPKYASRYKERFADYRARFIGEDQGNPRIAANLLAVEIPLRTTNTEPARPIVRRINTFPLLQTGLGGNALGSLVPLNGESGAQSLFIATAGSEQE